MVWSVAGAQDFILATPLLEAAALYRHAFGKWVLHSSGAGGSVTRDMRQSSLCIDSSAGFGDMFQPKLTPVLFLPDCWNSIGLK